MDQKVLYHFFSVSQFFQIWNTWQIQIWICESMGVWRDSSLCLSSTAQKAPNKFTDAMTTAPDPPVEVTSHSSYSTEATIIMPHLTLASAKKLSTSTRATSFRRTTLWSQVNFRELLVKARSLQWIQSVSGRRDINQAPKRDPTAIMSPDDRRQTRRSTENPGRKTETRHSLNDRSGQRKISDWYLWIEASRSESTKPWLIKIGFETTSCYLSIFVEIDHNAG